MGGTSDTVSYFILSNFRYSARKKDFWTEFCIHGSVHRDAILIRSNETQQYAGVYLLQNYSTCFGVYLTHHQEYIKLVQVIVSEQQPSANLA